MKEIKSFYDIPNWLIIAVITAAFVLIVTTNSNIGYEAYKAQTARIDTLEKLCNELQSKITVDSLAVKTLTDSTLFEHYLREELMYVGDGETMYYLKEPSQLDSVRDTVFVKPEL